ncbi:MAG: hypothetical protein ABIJ45_03025, partial [Candidatus Zixiibacteriota bacterium]
HYKRDARRLGEIDLDNYFNTYKEFADWEINDKNFLNSQLFKDFRKNENGYIFLTNNSKQFQDNSCQPSHKVLISLLYSLGEQEFSLVIWEVVHEDSLKFKCGAIIGGFTYLIDCYYMLDGSYLVIVESGWAQEGEIIDGEFDVYSTFFRVNNDDIYFLYEAPWGYNRDNADDRRVSFDYRGFKDSGRRQLVETIEYMTYDRNKPLKIDSVESHIIPLWEMAVEKFDIDTTFLINE